MLQKKICLLGTVGKTSLTRRFVHSVFSGQFHSTIGVKIDRKEIKVNDQHVKLLIWDIHSDDEIQEVRASYLRGMSGYILVADGTRYESMETVALFHDLAQETVGNLPFVLLINKSDLVSEWRIPEKDLANLTDAGWTIYRTSEKSGDHVEESFHELTARILANDVC